MKLYHFSEECSITEFQPRVKTNRQNMPPVVWAIDDVHAYTFYCPRDCPRIVYTRSEGLSDEEESRFFGLTSAQTVMTFETAWYERIRDTTIYRYSLPAEHFNLFDATAGYYISEQAATPIEIVALYRLLDRLIELNIDIRFTPNLHPLYNAILSSSLTDFGIHRFANATKV